MKSRFLRHALLALGLSLTLGGAIELSGCGSPPPPPPPPVQVEVRPATPGPRYIWVAGHWRWKGRARGYVWIPGHWKKQ